MNNTKTWVWVPGISIGQFFFNRPPSKDNFEILCKLEPDCEGADWDTYAIEVPGEHGFFGRVHIEENKIATVECTRILVYKSQNLIGKDTKESMKIIGGTWIENERWETGRQMDNDGLGVTLWEEDGRVESVTVGPVISQKHAPT